MLSWHQKPTYTSTLFQTLHVLASKTFCLLGSLCPLPSCFLFVLPHPGVSWVKITTSNTVLHAEICLPPVHYSVTAICCLTPSLGLLFFCGFFFLKPCFVKHRVWSEKDSSKSSLFHVYLQWTIFLIHYPLNDLKPPICCVPLHYLLFLSHPFLASTFFVLCLSFSAPRIDTARHDLEVHNEESHKRFSKCEADHKKRFLCCVFGYCCCYSGWALLCSKHPGCSLAFGGFSPETLGKWHCQTITDDREAWLSYIPTFIFLLRIYCYTHLTLWHFLISYVEQHTYIRLIYISL